MARVQFVYDAGETPALHTQRVDKTTLMKTEYGYVNIRTPTNNGDAAMAYETKVLLIAIAKIISKADNIEEIYEAVEAMANAEGLVLKPLEELRKSIRTAKGD